MSSIVKLRKAASVVGKTLVFRDVKVSDAAFILSLRKDPDKSRYLSAVSGGLADQESWLHRYGQSEDQAYFIIEHMGAPIGTVRLYDPRCVSFCWGSWILGEDRPSHAAMESALMVYAYAVDHLGFESSHFDVRKGNTRVWQFHERFGARRIAETELDYLYQIDAASIFASRQRYQRFLGDGVSVTWCSNGC